MRISVTSLTAQPQARRAFRVLARALSCLGHGFSFFTSLFRVLQLSSSHVGLVKLVRLGRKRHAGTETKRVPVDVLVVEQ